LSLSPSASPSPSGVAGSSAPSAEAAPIKPTFSLGSSHTVPIKLGQ
jgi:hypothetical protein